MKNGPLCWDIEALQRHVVAGPRAAKEQGYTPASIGTWAVDFILLDKDGKRIGDASPTEGTVLGNLAAQMIADGTFADLAAFRRALPDSFEIREYLPQTK